MAIEFHRLNTPAYFGGLPGTHDYINDPSANGDPGAPASADGKKGGTPPDSPNAGTYFIAFGEDVIDNNANRPNKALAQNTDYLDDVVHRNLGTPALKTVVLTGASQFVLTGEIFVGMPGTTFTANGCDLLVVVYKDFSGTLMPVSGLTPEYEVIPIHVIGIENGVGGSVLGDPIASGGDEDGFYTGPTIKLNQSLTGTFYVFCYERSNTIDRSPGMATLLEQLAIPPAILWSAIQNNAICGPSGGLPNWKDGETNPAPVTVDNQIKKIITDLGVDVEGSARINSQGYAAAVNTDFLFTTDTAIYSQMKEIIDLLDTLLDSRFNTWGGNQTFNGYIEFHEDISPYKQITLMGEDLLGTWDAALYPRMRMNIVNDGIGIFTNFREVWPDTADSTWPRKWREHMFCSWNLSRDTPFPVVTQNLSYNDTLNGWFYDDDSEYAHIIQMGGSIFGSTVIPAGETEEIDIIDSVLNYPQWSFQDQWETIGSYTGYTYKLLFKDGYIDFRDNMLGEVTNPPPNYAVRNKLFAKNVCKAWASIKTQGVMSYQGFNITGLALENVLGTKDTLKVEFAEPLTNEFYSVVGSVRSASNDLVYTLHCREKSTTTMRFIAVAHDIGGIYPPPYHSPIDLSTLASTDRIMFQVFGIQSSA